MGAATQASLSGTREHFALMQNKSSTCLWRRRTGPHRMKHRNQEIGGAF